MSMQFVIRVSAVPGSLTTSTQPVRLNGTSDKQQAQVKDKHNSGDSSRGSPYP